MAKTNRFAVLLLLSSFLIIFFFPVQILAANVEVKLDSENGSSAFMVKDSTSTAVASMDSAGNLKIKNKAANSQLSLSGNNIIQNGGDFFVNSAAGETWFQTMGTTRLILGGGGNVGVGIYPSQKLSVAGTIESTLGGVKFPDGTIQTTSSGVKGGGWIKGGGQVTLETTTDNVGIGITNPSAKLNVYDGAILANGNNGATPYTGAGTRMMWIPAKIAFRAGYVNSSQWDNSNIGSYSLAMGQNTIASGQNSIAFGTTAVATAFASTAIGYQTSAGGE